MPKALEKKKKRLKIKEKNQIKLIADHKKQLVESNAFVKKMIMVLKTNYFWIKRNFMTNFLMKGIMK